MKKEILLIDFDNTIADSPKAIVSCINEEFNKQFKMKDEFGWNFEGLLPREYVGRAVELFNEKKFFDVLEPIDNCIEVLERLNERFELIVVTKHSSEGVIYKEQWLKEYLPFIKRLITLHQDDYNKSFIQGDFLIDDKPECILGGNRKFNILFGDYKWNSVLHMGVELSSELIGNNTIKIKNWLDVEKFLNSLQTK